MGCKDQRRIGVFDNDVGKGESDLALAIFLLAYSLRLVAILRKLFFFLG